MSTNKNNQEIADREKLCAEKCVSIVRKFNNKLHPLGTIDFKNTLFALLFDAYVNRHNSMVTDDHISTLYFMWDIVQDVEDLKTDWGLPEEEILE